MTNQNREYTANVLDFIASTLRQLDIDGFIDDLRREAGDYPESRAECWRLERLAMAARVFQKDTGDCQRVTIREG